MNDWWKYDGRDEDAPSPARSEFFDDVDAMPPELATHEAAAINAIRQIADYGDAHPDKALIITATLRKIGTVAGSSAQALGLQTVRVKRN